MPSDKKGCSFKNELPDLRLEQILEIEATFWSEI
jgi:hypothetical protein